MTDDSSDDLSGNRRDLVVAAGRGLLGSIPVVGNLAAEAFGTLIPRQRLDRVVETLRLLGDRIATTEVSLDALRDRFAAEPFQDLFEEATPFLQDRGGGQYHRLALSFESQGVALSM